MRLFGRGAAPRAGEGAVQVPSARVAVVHDAGRLGSGRAPFLVTAVKVLWTTMRTGMTSWRICQDTPDTPRTLRDEEPLSGPREWCRNRYARDPLTPPSPPPYCHVSISNV
ncbi:hypothetical protein DWC19_29900 [Streptomyces sp. M7]|nr:hypothetical protein DWC19_29900 [Streptomyces sp. M7]